MTRHERLELATVARTADQLAGELNKLCAELIDQLHGLQRRVDAGDTVAATLEAPLRDSVLRLDELVGYRVVGLAGALEEMSEEPEE
jgi:hypothetical protein